MGHMVVESAGLSDVVDFASEDVTVDDLERGHRLARLSNQVLLPYLLYVGQLELYCATTPLFKDSVEFARESGASVS